MRRVSKQWNWHSTPSLKRFKVWPRNLGIHAAKLQTSPTLPLQYHYPRILPRPWKGCLSFHLRNGMKLYGKPRRALLGQRNLGAKEKLKPLPRLSEKILVT